MSISRVLDIELVRFAAPDLSRMEAFLRDFGMSAADGAEDRVLRMRGAGTAPFVHETIEGEAGFKGFALRVGSVAELEALAQAEGVEVETSRAPGGGYSVHLSDPDGFAVEVIAERARAEPLPRDARSPWNAASQREREGEAKRIPSGPATVERLGHIVLGVTDMQKTWDWYQSRFGLIISDEVRAPTGDVAALFIRCDRGSEAVDHHTLNFATIPGMPARFHHAAFEVLDLDDLMAGNAWLKDKGYRHDWGVGRHILGSQIFDYWRDPWGHRVEHWTDGDVFNADTPTNVTDIQTMMGHQWGPAAPEDFAV